MRVFKTWRDPYDRGFNTTRPREVVFDTGITVLVGCNGAGKTTLLKNIKEDLDEKEIPYLYLDSSKKDDLFGRAFSRGDYMLKATSLASSEGENICIYLNQIAPDIGRFITTGKSIEVNPFKTLFREEENEITSKERWILLDSLDSGYSIDNIVDLKDFLSFIIAESSSRGLETYIICTANEYELVRSSNCMDVMSGKYKEFPTYDSFRKFILHSKELKVKRESKE